MDRARAGVWRTAGCPFRLPRIPSLRADRVRDGGDAAAPLALRGPLPLYGCAGVAGLPDSSTGNRTGRSGVWSEGGRMARAQRGGAGRRRALILVLLSVGGRRCNFEAALPGGRRDGRAVQRVLVDPYPLPRSSLTILSRGSGVRCGQSAVAERNAHAGSTAYPGR